MGAQSVRLVTRRSRWLIRHKLRRQLKALRKVLPRLNRDQLPTAGLEIELHLVFSDGTPAHGIAQLVLAELARHGETRVVTELGDWQLELNLTPRSIVGQPFVALYDEAEVLLTRINELAAKHGAQAVLIGTLPTLTAADIAEQYLSPVDRYPMLDAGLWSNRAPEFFTLRLPDGTSRDIMVDTVRWEMVCTSVQPHFYFPGHQSVVTGHNVVVATAGPIIALTGNAPYAYGAAPVNDIRSSIFSVATGRRCWVNGYIRNPDDHLVKALTFDPIVTKPDHEWSNWRANRGVMPTLTALNVQSGTTWPMIVREVVDLLSGHQRHEIRYQSAGPTLADVFAFMVLVGGLMANPQSAALFLGLNEEDALSNFEAGCNTGPAAQMTWPGTQPNTPRAIVSQLRDLARDGWLRWGISPGEIDRFLAPIDALIEGAPSGASWQIQRTEYYLGQGYVYAEAQRRMLMDYMAEARGGLGRSVVHWPQLAAVSTGTRG